MLTGMVKRVRSPVFIVSDGISHGKLPLAEAVSQQTCKRSICCWKLLQSPAPSNGW